MESSKTLQGAWGWYPPPPPPRASPVRKFNLQIFYGSVLSSRGSPNSKSPFQKNAQTQTINSIQMHQIHPQICSSRKHSLEFTLILWALQTIVGVLIATADPYTLIKWVFEQRSCIPRYSSFALTPCYRKTCRCPITGNGKLSRDISLNLKFNF